MKILIVVADVAWTDTTQVIKSHDHQFNIAKMAEKLSEKNTDWLSCQCSPGRLLAKIVSDMRGADLFAAVLLLAT